MAYSLMMMFIKWPQLTSLALLKISSSCARIVASAPFAKVSADTYVFLSLISNNLVAIKLWKIEVSSLSHSFRQVSHL